MSAASLAVRTTETAAQWSMRCAVCLRCAAKSSSAVLPCLPIPGLSFSVSELKKEFHRAYLAFLKNFQAQCTLNLSQLPCVRPSVAAFGFPRLGWKHGSALRMAASMAEFLSPWESLVQMKSKTKRFIWNRLCYQGGICLAVQAVKSTKKITLAKLSLQRPLSESTSLSNTYLPEFQGRNPPPAPAQSHPRGDGHIASMQEGHRLQQTQKWRKYHTNTMNQAKTVNI